VRKSSAIALVIAGIFFSVFAVLGAAPSTVSISPPGAAPSLTVTPSSGPRGTQVTIDGENFTNSGNIAANGITLDGIPMVHPQIAATGGGELSASFRVPATTGLGAKPVSVIDSGSLAGAATFTVTQPTIAISPATAVMGQVITVTGTGWVPLTSAALTLTSGGVVVGIHSADADANGGFVAKIALPNTVGVGPKEVSFTAADAGSLGNTASGQTLTVTAPTMTLSAAEATVGSEVTVTAAGFMPYTALTAFSIGAADVRRGVAITDSTGSLSVTSMVPGFSGAQSVSITVGGVTSSKSIKVKPASTPEPEPAAATPAEPLPPAPLDEVFANLIANDGNLVRIFRFDNSTQTWAFFDPRPAFVSTNDLTAAGSGDIVWVKVNTQQEFRGRILLPGWSLFSLE